LIFGHFFHLTTSKTQLFTNDQLTIVQLSSFPATLPKLCW